MAAAASTYAGFPGMDRFSGAPYTGTGTMPPPPGSSSNQFGSFPGMPNPSQNNPYQVPGSTGVSGYNWGGAPPNFSQPSDPTTYYQDIHGGQTIAPQYPGLSGNFVNWLMQNMGSGLSPFNLSTPLPTGGATQPGQLTAGENPMLQQLQNLLSGGYSSMSNTPGTGTLSRIAGGSTPGMQTLQSIMSGGGLGEGALGFLAGGMQGSSLANIANNGISALPEWQQMIGAQNQNIQQNQANLREQFAGMGNLAGSPFGTAMSNYMQQTTKDQNALLGQLQQQNILQGQIPAAEQIASLQSGAGQALGGLQSGAANAFTGSQAGAGSTLSGMQGNLAQFLQSLNQSAIQNQYGEFARTQPQNNPLLQDILSMSQVYPPTIQQGVGGGGVGGMLSGAGSLAGGAGNVIGAASDAAMCWLTSACMQSRGLPDDCEELETLRWFRDNVILELPKGQEVIDEYDRIAPRIVAEINSRANAKSIWNKVYRDCIQDAVYLVQHDQNDAALKLYHNTTQRLKMEYLNGN